MARSFINNIEDLRSWFELINCGKWNLYRGHHERLPQTSLIFKQEKEGMTAEESFVLLQRLMEQSSHGGGYFTVYVPGRSSNKGYTQKVVLNGGSANSATSSAVSGHPAALGFVSQDELNRRISEALEKQEMQRRIEDLEAAREGNMSIGESLAQRFMESFDFNLLAPAINAFVAGVMPTKQPIQLQGTMQREEAPPMEQEQEMPGYEFEADRILPLLTEIHHHFTNDEEFYVFLASLTVKFCENPALYKGLMNPQA